MRGPVSNRSLVKLQKFQALREFVQLLLGKGGHGEGADSGLIDCSPNGLYKRALLREPFQLRGPVEAPASAFIVSAASNL